MMKKKSSSLTMVMVVMHRLIIISIIISSIFVQGMMLSPLFNQRAQWRNTHLFSTMNTNRRDFVVQGLVGGIAASASIPVLAVEAKEEEDTAIKTQSDIEPTWVSDLDSKNVKWDTTTNTNDGTDVQWNQLRYKTSTLEGQRQGPPTIEKNQVATPFPSWMEGTWLVSYKFIKATFPQGRDKLNLRIPGAGLGTCLALPNVGYNPSPFTCRYLKKMSSSSDVVYEDLAYNVPRRFEAFWPESKVTSIQTGKGDTINTNDNKTTNKMTPKCFVTGEGCTVEENPFLHDVPLSRVAMDFSGPTRRGGYLSQSIDTTMVGGDSYYYYTPYDSINGNGNNNKKKQQIFSAYRQYVQFNVNQDLQTFYKEYVSLNVPASVVSGNEEIEEITGRIRVAAFLPPSEAMAVSSSSSPPQVPYDNTSALALYDYKIKMKYISEEEASSV